jgi:hypothetical protein
MAPKKGPSARPEVEKQPEVKKSPSEHFLDAIWNLAKQARNIDIDDKKALKRFGERILKIAPKDWIEGQTKYYKQKRWEIIDRYDHPSHAEEWDILWDEDEPQYEFYHEGVGFEALKAVGFENEAAGVYLDAIKAARLAAMEYRRAVGRERMLKEDGVSPREGSKEKLKVDSIKFDKVAINYLNEIVDLDLNDKGKVEDLANRMLKHLPPEWVQNRFEHFADLLAEVSGDNDAAVAALNLRANEDSIGPFSDERDEFEHKFYEVFNGKVPDVGEYMRMIDVVIYLIRDYRSYVGSRGQTERERLSGEKGPL